MERFDGRIVATDAGGAAIRVPFDPVDVFGRVRVPVVATINGYVFRTTLMRYDGVDYLGVNRAVRDAVGVSCGASVAVTLEPDTAPREVAVPAELDEALRGQPRARTVFNALSYSHRREYVTWVSEARRPQTRIRRAQATIARLVGNDAADA